jgi:hypothetical protein
MTGFDLNEKIKERCVQKGAKLAITQFFKKGVPIIPEPFYETSILYDANTPLSVITEAFNTILKYKQVFDQYFFFTDPLVEKNETNNIIQIVYAIFLEEEPFNTEINLPITLK